jgi:Protein of unknown function (DUF732)
MILARTFAAVEIGAAALLTAATVRAAPSDDDAFLAALDKQGITYSSPQYAIRIGREICTLLDDGANGVNVSREISKNNGIPIENAGYFVGASIAAYCPSHSNAFGRP